MFQALNSHAWLVVTLLDSTDTEHFHSLGNFHWIALNTNLFSNPTLLVNSTYTSGSKKKKAHTQFESYPAPESIKVGDKSGTAKSCYLESKHAGSKLTLSPYK